MKEKTVTVIQRDYGYRYKEGNRDRCRRLFNADKFGPSDIDRLQKLATKGGYKLVVEKSDNLAKPSAPKTQPKAVATDEKGKVDKRGVLKLEGSGQEFVRECLTGKPVPIAQARFIGISSKDNLPYWIGRKDDLTETEMVYPSIFGAGKIKPRKLNGLRRRHESNSKNSC